LMRVLITGITGFAGCHLTERLIHGGDVEVHGISRGQRWLPGFAHLSKQVRYHRVDLLDEPALREALWLIQPDQIYHLAADADAGNSFRQARAVWEANLTATLNLYDACLSELAAKPKILFVSSGAIYGESAHGEQITESSAFRPNNPYAASKAAADLASFQYHASHGLPILRVRPFNQVGPGQSTQFALGRFADQLVRMEQGESPPVLRVGNLQAERDFTDVRDMVRAYQLLMEKGDPGQAYNAASGTTRPMTWFLERLLKATRLDVRVELDAGLLRPIETQRLRVNTQKLREAVGWQPAISIDQSINDLLQARRLAGQLDVTAWEGKS
jgi:GDP-4-dehydro-6-deoxy-D-mannose reductase